MQGYSVADRVREVDSDILALGNALAYRIVLHQTVLLTLSSKCFFFNVFYFVFCLFLVFILKLIYFRGVY